MKRLLFCCLFILSVSVCAASVLANDGVPRFDHAHSTWHGFDRYDFSLNLETQTVTPMDPVEGEGDGVREPEAGTRRCILVVPKEFAPGLPWSWRGCYWNHEPQTEIELLKRGFCIAYISTSRPDQGWETWYDFLTKQHGLSPKPAFIGMSRGGEFSYRWGTTHPDSVSCIYADNSGGNTDIFSKLHELAQRDVPLLNVNGSIDPLLPRVSDTIEKLYLQYGGRISVMLQEGVGHHPHSLRDPNFIADFIEKSFNEPAKKLPAFVRTPAVNNRRADAAPPTKPTAFYRTDMTYRKLPRQREWIGCRGAIFTTVYDKYEFRIPGANGTISVVVPETPAEGNPWVFRVDALRHDDRVCIALLEKGYHIVTGPVPYNAGPTLDMWNRAYDYLVRAGFSAKPILYGRRAASMSAYAWAIGNPDKVSAIYAENPILHRTTLCDKPIQEALDPIAEAKVPIYHAYTESDKPGVDELHDAFGMRVLIKLFPVDFDTASSLQAENIADELINAGETGE